MGLFRKSVAALFLSPEEYRNRYCDGLSAPPRGLPGPKSDALKLVSSSRDAPHIVISGGSSAARERVLVSMLEEQQRNGYTVVLLQPSHVPPPACSCPSRVLNAQLGSYDPFKGKVAWQCTNLLLDAAESMGMSIAQLDMPLADAMEYLFHAGTPTLNAFLTSSTRDIGANAFITGQDHIASSHSLPESRMLDSLRRNIARGLQNSVRSGAASGSILEATSTEITIVQLPQGNKPWVGFALSELLDMYNSSTGATLFPVFSNLGMYRDSAAPQLSMLTCGRCFCYDDLPGTDWLWDEATRSVNAACIMRHLGPSSEKCSAFFHQVERLKTSTTTTTSDASCDSGGFMGIFGSNTTSQATAISRSTQWEALVSARKISELNSNEAIFSNGKDVFCGTV